MADMTLKQWLEHRGFSGIKPGDPCWGLSYTTGRGYQVHPGKVTRIGREYVTTDIFRDSRFRVHSSGDAPYLDEADSNGLVQILFLSHIMMEAYMEREGLCSQLRQGVQKWSAGASIPRLRAAIAILDGTASEYAVAQVSAVLLSDSRKEKGGQR